MRRIHPDMNRYTKARLLWWRSKRFANRINEIHPLTTTSSVEQVDKTVFDEILSKYGDDIVFVHAGLSNIKKAVQQNPYDFLFKSLTQHFESVITPGFTPSFRESGIYHKLFSKPEYGMFSYLFHKDADYRTDDTIHSILVNGESIKFEDYEDRNRDSFGESSCWSKFDEKNTLYLNIGTDEFITTQLHYIEVKNDLPYVTVPEHKGIIYFDETKYDEVTQKNYAYEYDFPISTVPNWKKLRRYLKQVNVLQDYSVEGVKVYAFRARDVRDALESKLYQDPYYLVT